MNPNPIHQHLSHQQICDLLLSQQPLQSNTVSLDAGSDDARHEHLSGCLICSAELELLRTSVRGFRDTSNAIASRALARRGAQPSLHTLDRNRATRFISPAFFWAATALLFTAVLPLGLFHSNLNPFLKHHEPVATATTTAAPAATLESDEALLEGINQDLSASVPASMQPLTGTANTTSSTDSTQQMQRNN